MKLYHIYNENFEITHAQFFNEAEQPENAVFIENCDFIKPMVNPQTLEVYEGATPEELQEIQRPILLERLQDYSIDLRLRAKASAIGKKGSRDYIFAQVEMYELKYKIAKGLVVGQYFTDLLTNEALEFGLSIEDFKALIISRYESAEAVYQQFLFMIERCRTFIQTLIENNEFVKVATVFDMIDTLDAPEEAQGLMTSILEL